MSKSAPSKPRDDLAEFCRFTALVLGGVFASTPVDNDVIWRIAAGVERVYRQIQRGRYPGWNIPSPVADAMAKAGDNLPSAPLLAAHPAIKGLLDLGAA